jgi:hypothetical protein
LTRAEARRVEDRDEKMSRIILYSIERELRDVEFFTREDLLQLTPLQAVATITRYREVCNAVQRLIASRRMVEISRTELALAGHSNRGRAQAHELFVAYADKIDRILAMIKRKTPSGRTFTVWQVVLEWVSDAHLTLNAKRVAVRQRLKKLASEGVLGRGELLDYYFNEEK